MHQDLLNYILENRVWIFKLTGLHIGIVLVSTAIAIAIALPLGILVTRPGWEQHTSRVLNLTNIFQTVPSLAVIGLSSALLAYFNIGIGWTPAIVALVLYSILPVLTNIIAGMNNVPTETQKVARGMGLSDRQILQKVELPLAFPVILAGIRTAVVINIGTAALAATIGADCLGTLIFQGIATGNVTILLAGAIPTAILAVIIDRAFGLLDKRGQTAERVS